MPFAQTMTIEERFWSKVDKSGNCWLWTGSTTANGYAQFWIRKKVRVGVHRYAYELLVGPIPYGLTIDHLCGTKLCVRPDHLEAVPSRVNTLRCANAPAAVNAAKVACNAGHPLSGDNLMRSGGRRYCRICARARVQKHRDAHREEIRARANARWPERKLKRHG